MDDVFFGGLRKKRDRLGEGGRGGLFSKTVENFLEVFFDDEISLVVASGLTGFLGGGFDDWHEVILTGRGLGHKLAI